MGDVDKNLYPSVLSVLIGLDLHPDTVVLTEDGISFDILFSFSRSGTEVPGIEW